MGAMKQWMMDRDVLRCIAIDVAAATGAVKRCPFHGTPIDQYDDDSLQGAYRLANKKISDGEIELPDGFSRRDFTDIIKSEVKFSAVNCPECERCRARRGQRGRSSLGIGTLYRFALVFAPKLK
jgi:hypothetical protein